MGHDYQEREVTFTREGKKIYGKLFMPDVDGKPPLVIICHGFAGNHEGVLDYAAVFAREGIAAYAFDFIGGGPDIKSDGIMLDMTVLTEARDLDVIIDGFIAAGEIDPNNIFLMGESQGGFVSTYVAASRPSDIRALVAFFPAYVIQDDSKARIEEFGTELPSINVMGMQISVLYGLDATSFDIYEKMKAYDRKVLILHGTVDRIVPLSYSERAAKTFPSARLITFEGADHGFGGADREKATRLALDFVRSNLG